jgi:biotin operon repressor
MYSQIEQKLNGRWDKSSIIFKIDNLIKDKIIIISTRSRYSKSEDAEIIKLYNQNKLSTDIAEMLNLTKRGVNNKINKLREDGQIVDNWSEYEILSLKKLFENINNTSKINEIQKKLVDDFKVYKNSINIQKQINLINSFYTPEEEAFIKDYLQQNRQKDLKITEFTNLLNQKFKKCRTASGVRQKIKGMNLMLDGKIVDEWSEDEILSLKKLFKNINSTKNINDIQKRLHDEFQVDKNPMNIQKQINIINSFYTQEEEAFIEDYLQQNRNNRLNKNAELPPVLDKKLKPWIVCLFQCKN